MSNSIKLTNQQKAKIWNPQLEIEMTEQQKFIIQQAKKQHEKNGVSLDLNQTIVKGQIYGYIGSGYSVKGWRGYYTFTVVEAKTNDYFRVPAHWNKEIFAELDGCGKVFGGSDGGNTEYDCKRSEYEKEYPGIIWI